MEWFGIREIGVLVFCAWLFVSIAYLPRVIKTVFALTATTLLVGIVIAWGFGAISDVQPAYFMFQNVLVIFSAGLAIVHSEVLFHRGRGYWRFAGRSAGAV